MRATRAVEGAGNGDFVEHGASPAVLARDARIKVAAERVAAALAAGGYRSAFRGQGVEFDEVREYHDGDDVRTIDWNVTSRLGGATSCSAGRRGGGPTPPSIGPRPTRHSASRTPPSGCSPTWAT